MASYLSMFALLVLTVSVCANPIRRPSFARRAPGPYSPIARRSPSPDVVSSNVLSLTRKTGGSRSNAALRALASRSEVNGVYGITKLDALLGGQEYSTTIQFGSKSYQAIVDTGSSDTWLVEGGFKCLDVDTGDSETEAYCDFGPTYTPSSTFTRIPNQNFNITYADGEYLNGFMGHEHVTLAGIEVENQEVGVVNVAAWDGDGTTSGLIGLAFPDLTSAYPGDNPLTDQFNESIIYNPIFTNMYEEGHVPPVFSLALARASASSGDLMALGGLPPVVVTSSFASSPFELLIIQPQYQFYTINIQGTKFTGSQKFDQSGLNAQYIVDSGTTLIYTPTPIANAYNALFVPPAKYSDDVGGYVTSCDAKVPTFGVTIGGMTFYVNPEDMLMDVGLGNGECLTGLDDGGEGEDGFFILGDTFLTNVLAVFDVGASQMRFAAREYYP